jgi:hypothetical protein
MSSFRKSCSFIGGVADVFAVADAVDVDVCDVKELTAVVIAKF